MNIRTNPVCKKQWPTYNCLWNSFWSEEGLASRNYSTGMDHDLLVVCMTTPKQGTDLVNACVGFAGAWGLITLPISECHLFDLFSGQLSHFWIGRVRSICRLKLPTELEEGCSSLLVSLFKCSALGYHKSFRVGLCRLDCHWLKAALYCTDMVVPIMFGTVPMTVVGESHSAV